MMAFTTGHIDYFTADTADLERRLAEAERRYDLLAIRLECEALLADDVFIIEYEPLSIIAYGETEGAAKDMFQDYFAWLWGQYAEADDSVLTADAVALKRRLWRIVEDD